MWCKVHKMPCCAGLVKLLRRCLTQMSSRTRSFIDTCIKFERDARQQARLIIPALICSSQQGRTSLQA